MIERMEVIGFVGPMRATLTPEGRYVRYYIRPEESNALLGWLAPESAANDAT